MPGTKVVKELMVPISKYPVIYDTDSLKDAIKGLKNFLNENKEHRSMLVLKREGNEEKLAGILTVQNILFAIKAKTMCKDEDEDYTMSWSRLYNVGSICKVFSTVGDVIRPLKDAVVQSDQDVTDAIRLLMTNNVNILPVCEGEKVIGIIRAIDILDYIGELL